MSLITQSKILGIIVVLSCFMNSAYSVSIVESELALPISEGGISIHTMLDQSKLGRDSTKILSFWTYGSDGAWHSVTRSGSQFSLQLGSGESTLSGGPFGGSQFSRVLDGISDYDTYCL